MNIIDIFAGCGGMSLGFEMSGFSTILAIEKDEWASETYRKNHPNTKLITDDISNIKDLSVLIDKNTIVDGVIGGPPCQSFSLSGKRDKNDPRNSLFVEFVRFVDFFKPKFFVMENVPGILSKKTNDGNFVKDIILYSFEKIDYIVKIFSLNSADFGVPQSRQRIFFIGFPKKFVNKVNGFKIKELVYPDDYISVWDAISDLPQISSGEGNEIQKYNSEPVNNYQKWCRQKNELLHNHVAMKHTKRLIDRFSHIGFGQSVADVKKEFGQRKRGDASKLSGKVYSQNNFRPFPDKPSPTIPASFQSNFVHPYLNRNYTAREGARLQSFPDSYIFYGKRTTMSWEKNLSQYQQIGNAVPPLLAKAIADNILVLLKDGDINE